MQNWVYKFTEFNLGKRIKFTIAINGLISKRTNFEQT